MGPLSGLNFQKHPATPFQKCRVKPEQKLGSQQQCLCYEMEAFAFMAPKASPSAFSSASLSS